MNSQGHKYPQIIPFQVGVIPEKARSKARKKCIFWETWELHRPPQGKEGLLLKDICIFLLEEADPIMAKVLVWVRDTMEKPCEGDKPHRRFVHAVWAGESAGTFPVTSLPRSCLPAPLPFPLPLRR